MSNSRAQKTNSRTAKKSAREKIRTHEKINKGKGTIDIPKERKCQLEELLRIKNEADALWEQASAGIGDYAAAYKSYVNCEQLILEFLQFNHDDDSKNKNQHRNSVSRPTDLQSSCEWMIAHCQNVLDDTDILGDDDSDSSWPVSIQLLYALKAIENAHATMGHHIEAARVSWSAAIMAQYCMGKDDGFDDSEQLHGSDAKSTLGNLRYNAAANVLSYLEHHPLNTLGQDDNARTFIENNQNEFRAILAEHFAKMGTNESASNRVFESAENIALYENIIKARIRLFNQPIDLHEDIKRPFFDFMLGLGQDKLVAFMHVEHACFNCKITAENFEQFTQTIKPFLVPPVDVVEIDMPLNAEVIADNESDVETVTDNGEEAQELVDDATQQQALLEGEELEVERQKQAYYYAFDTDQSEQQADQLDEHSDGFEGGFPGFQQGVDELMNIDEQPRQYSPVQQNQNILVTPGQLPTAFKELLNLKIEADHLWMGIEEAQEFDNQGHLNYSPAYTKYVAVEQRLVEFLQYNYDHMSSDHKSTVARPSNLLSACEWMVQYCTLVLDDTTLLGGEGIGWTVSVELFYILKVLAIAHATTGEELQAAYVSWSAAKMANYCMSKECSREWLKQSEKESGSTAELTLSNLRYNTAVHVIGHMRKHSLSVQGLDQADETFIENNRDEFAGILVNHFSAMRKQVESFNKVAVNNNMEIACENILEARQYLFSNQPLKLNETMQQSDVSSMEKRIHLVMMEFNDDALHTLMRLENTIFYSMALDFNNFCDFLQQLVSIEDFRFTELEKKRIVSYKQDKPELPKRSSALNAISFAEKLESFRKTKAYGQFELRSHQESGYDNTQKHLAAGNDKSYLVCADVAGNPLTYAAIFLGIFHESAQDKDARSRNKTLYVVSNRTVFRDAMKSIQESAKVADIKDLDVRIYTKHSLSEFGLSVSLHKEGGDVTLITLDALYKELENSSDDTGRKRLHLENYKVAVLADVHTHTAKSRSVIERFTDLGIMIMGGTSDYGFASASSLLGRENCVSHYSLSQGIEEKVLAGARVGFVELGFPYVSKAFDETIAQKLAQVFMEIKRPTDGKPIHELKSIIFCSTQEYSDAIAKCINKAYHKNNVSTQFAACSVTNEDQTQLSRFQSDSSLNVACNVNILKTGVVVPNVEVIIILSSQSKLHLEQILNHGHGKAPGKECLLVIQLDLGVLSRNTRNKVAYATEFYNGQQMIGELHSLIEEAVIAKSDETENEEPLWSINWDRNYGKELRQVPQVLSPQVLQPVSNPVVANTTALPRAPVRLQQLQQPLQQKVINRDDFEQSPTIKIKIKRSSSNDEQQGVRKKPRTLADSSTESNASPLSLSIFAPQNTATPVQQFPISSPFAPPANIAYPQQSASQPQPNQYVQVVQMIPLLDFQRMQQNGHNSGTVYYMTSNNGMGNIGGNIGGNMGMPGISSGGISGGMGNINMGMSGITSGGISGAGMGNINMGMYGISNGGISGGMGNINIGMSGITSGGISGGMGNINMGISGISSGGISGAGMSNINMGISGISSGGISGAGMSNINIGMSGISSGGISGGMGNINIGMLSGLSAIPSVRIPPGAHRPFVSAPIPPQQGVDPTLGMRSHSVATAVPATLFSAPTANNAPPNNNTPTHNHANTHT